MNADPDHIPFSDMFSACPVEEVSAGNRADPYWQGLFVGKSQVSWLSRSVARRKQDGGLGHMRSRDLTMTPERARQSLLARNSFRKRRLSTLAAIGMWRTMSVEQIAAVVGSPKLARHAGDLDIGYSAGLLERGRFVTGMVGDKRLPFATLYRPIEGRAFDEFATTMSYPEWVSVTAGYPWRAGNQYDRHNMLATEFGLRVAEFCEIGSVTGESLSSFGLLAPEHAVPLGSKHRAADLTLVRKDGMKIAVELTANSGADFKKKVMKWAETLGNIDPSQSGLSVVFLVAHDPDRPRDLHRAILRTVEEIVYDIPGARRRFIPDRMAVANWRDWFPASRCATEPFRTLDCLRPTGDGSNRWEPVSLLDQDDLTFAPDDEFGALAALENLNGLWGVPHWLRDETQAPDFGAIAVQRAGYERVPRPPKIARRSA